MKVIIRKSEPLKLVGQNQCDQIWRNVEIEPPYLEVVPLLVNWWSDQQLDLF